MNALEKAQELIENGKNVPKRTLFVAYLAFHMANPALHPDDHLRNDEYNPYQGWEVILCNQVVNSEITEAMHYPTSFLKLPAILEELNSFHEDIWKDSQDDLDYQMWGNVGDVIDWLDDMDTKDIHLVEEALLKLHLYHASENDTLEEEEEKPAGILRTCHDTLLWISQQAN
jgi:hypothetical protein